MNFSNIGIVPKVNEFINALLTIQGLALVSLLILFLIYRNRKNKKLKDQKNMISSMIDVHQEKMYNKDAEIDGLEALIEDLKRSHLDEISAMKNEHDEQIDMLAGLHETEVKSLEDKNVLLEKKLAREQNANYLTLVTALDHAESVPAELDDVGVLKVEGDNVVDTTLKIQAETREKLVEIDENLKKREDMSIE